MFDRLEEGRIFTKLDLRNNYQLIRIKDGDDDKTAFRTPYAQFEYRVIPFWMMHAPATLQAHINDWVRPYINECALCNDDNILVYSTNEEHLEEQVRKGLERQREFGLDVRAE
jgi:hypothetical protein